MRDQWEIYTVLADADVLHGDDGMPAIGQSDLVASVPTGGTTCC